MEAGDEIKAEDQKSEEMKLDMDDTNLFHEEEEPAEFAEENLEPMDDNLLCPICLDLFYNPICTM
jgi:hypothetical protein